MRTNSQLRNGVVGFTIGGTSQVTAKATMNPSVTQPAAPCKPSILCATKSFLRLLWRTSPALVSAAAVFLVMSCITVVLMQVDARTLQGVSVWLKPWKFQVSTSAYLLTLAVFMVWLPKPALKTLAIRYVVWMSLFSATFEVAYITWQGGQGVASHFNRSTGFTALMYTLMGVGAVLLTSTSLVLGIAIGRSKAYELAPVLKLSIVLGLLLTFALGTGFGAYLGGQANGHWVGTAANTATDAGGLPIFAWSRTGGDLRVAHFFGIHAMHFIPAFGWVIHRLRTGRTPALASTWAFAAAYCVLCVWTFVQARGGLPFLS